MVVVTVTVHVMVVKMLFQRAAFLPSFGCRGKSSAKRLA